MSYHIEVKKGASRSLARLPNYDRQRILEAIVALSENPRPAGCKKLKGRAGWRIRSQTYRIIYDIEDSKKQIIVQVIGHRKDVYRG